MSNAFTHERHRISRASESANSASSPAPSVLDFLTENSPASPHFLIDSAIIRNRVNYLKTKDMIFSNRKKNSYFSRIFFRFTPPLLSFVSDAFDFERARPYSPPASHATETSRARILLNKVFLHDCSMFFKNPGPIDAGRILRSQPQGNCQAPPSFPKIPRLGLRPLRACGGHRRRIPRGMEAAARAVPANGRDEPNYTRRAHGRFASGAGQPIRRR